MVQEKYIGLALAFSSSAMIGCVWDMLHSSSMQFELSGSGGRHLAQWHD